MQGERLHLDVVIFGGGVAGLWLLDAIARTGRSAVLLEAQSLGTGQTIASQGIIHGGLKYTLRGALTESARAIAAMPDVWRDCFTGTGAPDLSNARLRAEFCYLWRTESVKSRLGMIGAKAGLRVAPVQLDASDRPAALANCPGTVARLDEQVVDVGSMLAALAEPHRGRIWKIDADRIEIAVDEAQPRIQVATHGEDDSEARTIELCAECVILAAGAGNAKLRAACGLHEHRMQRRPLHMVMMRGMQSALNGHCVDGRATRLTITSDVDSAGRMIWQIGGQLAERGVDMERDELIEFAASELRAALPGIDLSDCEFATYRVDRAERDTQGRRPDDATVIEDGAIITCWPTKLVLAPHLADRVMRMLPEPVDSPDDPTVANWLTPDIALPPWETEQTWTAARSAVPG